MGRVGWVVLGAVGGLIGLGMWGVARPGGDGVQLLNASYDPTRELWREVNRQFRQAYERETGVAVGIKQSHGSSTGQARAVIDGLEADVVTLAMWPDTDIIRRKGLVAEGWEGRLPNGSLPYLSTIVFVVRKGNPLGIHDWPDLVKPGVKIITPNPKTSGNGKLAFLAAWAAVRHRGGSDEEARDYVTQLYRRVPVLENGARAATVTFAQKRIGDVHLAWENEARLEVRESRGRLQIVYPPVSIRAEPTVAVVDATVDRKGTRAVAEAYLKFLYTEEGQEIVAKHFYRPMNPEVLARHAEDFPALEMLPVTAVASGWDEAQRRFFAEGGEFDRIYSRGR